MQLPRPTTNDNLLGGVSLLADALENNMLQLAAPHAGRKVATGTGTATWTASQFSATSSVTHGLGVVPVFWIAFSVDAGQVIHYFTGLAPTATAVTFQGDATGVVSFSRTFCWVAIS